MFFFEKRKEISSSTGGEEQLKSGGPGHPIVPENNYTLIPIGQVEYLADDDVVMPLQESEQPGYSITITPHVMRRRRLRGLQIFTGSSRTP